MTMLSIFEEAVIERSIVRDVACKFCGEVMSSAFMDTNHGIIFNGWCVKAMMFHNRSCHNDPDEIAWLERNRIDPQLSRFDDTHWHHANISTYYSQNFNYRMGVELEAGQRRITPDPQTDNDTIGGSIVTAEEGRNNDI